jgi:transcriptional regulator with XRE-family HTH domain
MSNLSPIPLEALQEQAREAVARNLSAARSALGISQDQLAETAGVSRATINQLESADGDPRLTTLAAVAAALGVSPMFLLLGHDEIRAIAHASGSLELRNVQAHMPAESLEVMRRLLGSGIPRNRAKAVAMGTSAAQAAGFAASGAIAAAAIGTVLLPGIGTAVGVALSTWFAVKAAKAVADREDK